jgi:hypothetical protein
MLCNDAPDVKLQTSTRSTGTDFAPGYRKHPVTAACGAERFRAVRRTANPNSRPAASRGSFERDRETLPLSRISPSPNFSSYALEQSILRQVLNGKRTSLPSPEVAAE